MSGLGLMCNFEMNTLKVKENTVMNLKYPVDRWKHTVVGNKISALWFHVIFN